jgi:hypothetical protein
VSLNVIFIKKIFETFNEHALWNKLWIGTVLYHLDLQIKSYGEMKNMGEVWIGQASARANQQELTTCAQKCGQEEEGEFCKEGKMGTSVGEAGDH